MKCSINVHSIHFTVVFLAGELNLILKVLKSHPIMLAQCLMLLLTYYGQKLC